MEIEGLPDLKVEQAFELTDATAVSAKRRLRQRVASAFAERSCAGSTIKLSEATVTEYIQQFQIRKL